MEKFAVSFVPLYTILKLSKALHDEKVHHIIVNGCSNTRSENNGRIESTSNFRCNDKKILYAWALNAGELVLPEGAAVPIGGHSNVYQVQLECHYKDKYNGKDRVSTDRVFDPDLPAGLYGPGPSLRTGTGLFIPERILKLVWR